MLILRLLLTMQFYDKYFELISKLAHRRISKLITEPRICGYRHLNEYRTFMAPNHLQIFPFPGTSST